MVLRTVSKVQHESWKPAFQVGSVWCAICHNGVEFTGEHWWDAENARHLYYIGLVY